MPLRIFFLLQLLLTGTVLVRAQRMDHLPGELIVELQRGVRAAQWAKDHPDLITTDRLISTTNLHLVRFDHDAVSEGELLRQLRSDARVNLVQFNHPVLPRRRPNDTRYDELWQYRNVGQIDGTPGADLNVETAWNASIGGTTENGDTIVVAVLDDGTDLDHEDLVANLWRNHDEIPDNGVDDDNNGYVDDYYGFDTENNDGNPEAATSHGTPVAGIIGAVGNNDLGVTGVNWNVRLMTVRNGFLSSESEVLQAYGYALDARVRYNETGGAEGAYVTVTNASWGRNYGNVTDSPIWCNLYDQLGAAGILNIGAAANLDIDVDELGDLPTNCPSDYLIGVTSIDTRNARVGNAAFGAVSVDLGAYGKDILTTTVGNNYGFVGGTSYATPHVAGAAALLYSAPCASFGELLEADPPAAALFVRRVLLETARNNTELTGRTSTNGQLDIGAAMNRMMQNCSDCLTPTSFTVAPEPGSGNGLVVSFNKISSITNTTLRYRRVGTEAWAVRDNPVSPLSITGLSTCTDYEFELTAKCGDRDAGRLTLTMSTDGCCVIPDDFTVRPLSEQLFTTSWTPVLAGRRYRLRYRKLGATDWTTRTSTQDGLGIGGGIEPCTAYEFEFQTDCDTTATAFGSRTVVISNGCGACLEETYCAPNGYDNSTDWIAEVNIGNSLINRTSQEVRGYGDYSGAEGMTVVRGGVYPMRLLPQREGNASIEDFRVYADWNHDGFFSSREIVGEATSRGGDAALIDLVVPDDAPELSTRIRVLMNFINIRGNACSGPAQGEYEDYCLDVRAAEGCPAPVALFAAFSEEEGETALRWRSSRAAGGEYRVRYRPESSGADWTETDVNGLSLEVPDLNLCRAYEVELASLCGEEPGPFRAFRFLDNCTDTRDRSLPAEDWTLSPNPATTYVRLAMLPALRPRHFRLFSVTGRVVATLPVTSATLTVNIDHVPSGLYLAELTTADGRRGVRKLLVR